MSSFFSELRRRNVFRVSIAYVIVAWLLIQVTDSLVPMLGLPDWVGKFIFVIVLIGFPLAVFFAWAFELTPEGLKRETEVDRSDSVTVRTGRKIDEKCKCRRRGTYNGCIGRRTSIQSGNDGDRKEIDRQCNLVVPELCEADRRRSKALFSSQTEELEGRVRASRLVCDRKTQRKSRLGP